MQLTLDSNNAQYNIQKYDINSITVNHHTYKQSILLTPTMIKLWPITNVEQLCDSIWTELLQLKPEILLLGTGNIMKFPKPEQLQIVYSARIGLEIMATPAACRTYTILAAENRNVLAALICANL